MGNADPLQPAAAVRREAALAAARRRPACSSSSRAAQAAAPRLGSRCNLGLCSSGSRSHCVSHCAWGSARGSRQRQGERRGQEPQAQRQRQGHQWATWRPGATPWLLSHPHDGGHLAPATARGGHVSSAAALALRLGCCLLAPPHQFFGTRNPHPSLPGLHACSTIAHTAHKHNQATKHKGSEDTYGPKLKIFKASPFDTGMVAGGLLARLLGPRI